MNLVALPAYSDNSRWMLHDARQAIVVDPGEAAPVLTARGARGRALSGILVTLASLLSAGCANLPVPPPAVATVVAAEVPTAAAAPLPPSSAAATVVRAVPDHASALDPLRPSVRIDFDDRAAQTDLWARLREGYAMAEVDGPLVRQWEAWYSARPDYVQRMTERGGRYLFYVIEEVQRRGLPTELALLPFVESAFNPQAMSTAKASGMWQFVPATGRDFALRQNVFRDDRRDVLASTRAALDYLQALHGMFGDWQLALAAYNWGQGNVQRALARNQKAGLAQDYASLRMPDETRNYLPKLQAVKNIVSRPEAFGLGLPALANHPYFVTVPIDRDIDVELSARLAGLPLDEFRQLNPQFDKPVILAAGTPQVLLPYDAANRFVRALALHDGALASWTAWVAPRTDKPSALARQLGMSEAQLREINSIVGNVMIKSGSTLLVPRNAERSGDVSDLLADSATLSLAAVVPPARRVSVKVGKKGETVAAVARRYQLVAAHVAEWNSTAPGGSFKPNQVIVLMLPVAKATPPSRVAAVARAGGPSIKRPNGATRPARTRVAAN